MEDHLFLGELSLDGSLRPVAGVMAIAAAVRNLGLAGLVVPANNAQEAVMVPGLKVYGFKHLTEVVDFLNHPEGYLGWKGLVQSCSTALYFQDVKAVF